MTVGGLTFTAAYTLTNNTVTFGAAGTISNSAAVTIASVIAGTGPITKDGAGTLTLATTNTYTGGTVMNQGTIAGIKATSLGTGAITFAGNSTLQPAYNVFPVLSNSVVVNSGVTATVSSVNQYYGMTFPGPLSGSGTLSVTMANAANTLPNAGFTSTSNTFTGPLIATGAGTVRVNSLADSPNPIRLGVNSIFELGPSTPGNAASLVFSNRPIQLTGAAGTSTINNNNSNVTIAVFQNLGFASVTGNKTLTFSSVAGPTNVFAGNIADPPGYTNILTKNGTGTWIVSGSNTYSGGTTVSAGTWDAASTYWNAVADGTGSAAAWTAGRTATFAAGTDATGAYTVTVDGTPDIGGLTFEEGAVTLSGGTALRLVSDSLAYVATNRTATIATPLSQDATARQLIKSGPGTLILTAGNSYSGATTVGAGTLQLAHTNAIGSSTNLIMNGGATVLDTAVNLSILTIANSYAAARTVVSGGTLAFGPGGTIVGQNNANGIALTILSPIAGRPNLSQVCSSSGTDVTGGIKFAPTNGTAALGTFTFGPAAGGDKGVLWLSGTTTDNTISNIVEQTRYSLMRKSDAGEWTVTGTAQVGRIYIDGGVLKVTGTLTIGAGVLGFSDFVFTHPGGLQAGTYKLITSGGISGTLDGADLSGASGAFTGTLQITGDDLELVVSSGGPLGFSGFGPLSGTSFPLTFSGPSGQGYLLLTSTNVALPLSNWTVLAVGTFSNSPVTYTDTNATNPQQFYCLKPLVRTTVLQDDFERGAAGWTTGSDGAAGTAWELGTPRNVGPTAAHSGTNCFGSNIADNYALDANIWLRSPVIDLTAAPRATLEFWQFTALWGQGADFGTVRLLEASSGSVLAVLATPVEGFSGGWVLFQQALPAVAYGKQVKLEFRLEGVFGGLAGWYLDDVQVTVP